MTRVANRHDKEDWRATFYESRIRWRNVHSFGRTMELCMILHTVWTNHGAYTFLFPAHVKRERVAFTKGYDERLLRLSAGKSRD